MCRVGKVINAFIRELLDVLEAILRWVPGQTGFLLRWVYYKCVLKRLGAQVRIYHGVYFKGSRHISIGDHCTIGPDTIIYAGALPQVSAEHVSLRSPEFKFDIGEVVLGRFVYLSAHCYILGNGGVSLGDYSCCARNTSILSFSNHYRSFQNPSNREIYFTHRCGAMHECYLSGPIVLMRNVGVATNVVVLPGVTLYRDCFVSVGSVVHRGEYPPNSLLAGNPAKVVHTRYEEDGTDAKTQQ